jgi:hypothetical protein
LPVHIEVAKKSKLPYYGPLDIDHFIKHRKSLIRPVGRGCNGCLKIINPSSGAKSMSKEHKNIKAEKKKPAKSPKEKKATKKAKKASRK